MKLDPLINSPDKIRSNEWTLLMKANYYDLIWLNRARLTFRMLHSIILYANFLFVHRLKLKDLSNIFDRNSLSCNKIRVVAIRFFLSAYTMNGSSHSCNSALIVPTATRFDPLNIERKNIVSSTPRCGELITQWTWKIMHHKSIKYRFIGVN